MDHNNIKFKVVSLNVRGIRTFEKKEGNFLLVYETKCRLLFSTRNL